MQDKIKSAFFCGRFTGYALTAIDRYQTGETDTGILDMIEHNLRVAIKYADRAGLDYQVEDCINLKDLYDFWQKIYEEKMKEELENNEEL